MAAAASGSAPPPDAAGARRGRGRPRGSKSGRGRGRGRSPSLRRSKPSKRPRPSSRSPSGSPDGPHSSPPRGVDLSAPLPPGTDVEVRVDDDGFHGSWFEATVLDFTPARGYRHPARYTVKYAHLLADDDEGVLAEPFAPSHIRPRPPPPPPSPPPRFQTHDIVEAFHNEGWWSGIVVSAPAGSGSGAAGVTVAFPITREVIEFAPGLVRPRRDYVDGDWIPSQVAMVVRPKRAVKVYEVGDKVEVVRQRSAYGESWFLATVRVVVDDLSYVVEYFDLEEGEGGPEKATEYLHWWFIRPAVEHAPRESEFKLQPGAAVEAYCDGAWSPGVVRRVLGEGEYEIGIVAKKSEMLVTKVAPLLKPQYKWNGKQWKIATRKRRANSRRRSVSGNSPRSPVEVSSSDEEHSLGKSTLAEGSGHASVSEMDIPLSALCKSPESTHSPNSFVSEKNSLQGSHGIMNSVPMNGLLCASPGHSAPVDNQEILSDMVVTDGELNGPVSGRSVGGHDMLSITELRKKMASAPRNKKMASARRNSAVTRKQENPAKSLRVKKCVSDIKAGKMHPIQGLQGKVSIGTKRGSSTKVLASKKLANRRGSKELCSSNSSLDVTRTVQQRGSKEFAEPMEECPLALECLNSDTQKQLDRTLEDAQNITELSNQDLLPMVPPGFKSMDNGRGTNIHDTQFDEEPTGNDDMCTDHAATKLAESNHVMETAILCLDCPAQQARGKVDERSVLQNAGSSQCIIDSSPLRSCSAFESLLPSPQPFEDQALFVKNSPMWDLVEAMHVFKELPQQPHFLPLQEHAPLLREGMALGMMVSFMDLVKVTMEASIDNSMEWFEDKIRTISHLEANGFSVQFMQSAMTDLVKIKSERTSYHVQIGKLDSKFVEKTASSSRVGALLDEKDIAAAELEQELGRIRQESQKIAKEKEKIDAELASIKTSLSGYEVLCDGVERYLCIKVGSDRCAVVMLCKSFGTVYVSVGIYGLGSLMKFRLL
ncbi:unnamed protein product [Miscanthus lutarioriparius]|uniref:Agenet domain-containing protein n=1 Tax=Miscanthus lutarioriparius TaxID=422564 RepID=A0A811Q9W3_9POAL|nr:unnamed protein product [Miscanthus lutarioriparius]